MSVDAKSALRACVQGGLVTALVIGCVGSGPAAQASPEKVLQAVDVTLGTDGTVAGITSTAIRKGEDSTRSDRDVVDPSAEADRLPVRIQTAYRLGDRAGTDLSEIAGESGRVVIDVTVQNTTVRPQHLTYDSAGVRKRAYALVGTPLTVVASAANSAARSSSPRRYATSDRSSRHSATPI